MLHGHLELDRGARSGVFRGYMTERDVPLEQRRPGAAGRVAYLFAIPQDRRAGAPRNVGDVRGEAAVLMQPFEGHPVHLETNEAPRGTAPFLLAMSGTSRVRSLGLADGPSEPELIGRRLLVFDHRVMRREVVDVEHHEPRLDARDVQRPDPGG